LPRAWRHLPRTDGMRAATSIIAGILTVASAAIAAPSATQPAPAATQAPAPAAVLSPGAAPTTPSGVILDCAKLATSKLEPLDHLVTRCPGLDGALIAVGFKDSLSAQRRDGISAATLVGLAALADRYQRPMPVPPLDKTSLRAVLDGLASERAQESHSLWDSFRKWLETRIGGSGADAAHWLDRWLGRLSSAAHWLTLLTFALMGLVLVAAALYIYREFKTARSPGRRIPDGEPLGEPILDSADRPLSFEAAPLFDRPGILLRMLIARLVNKGALMSHRHLTHRELAASIRLDDPKQRDQFGDLANLAERILYGGAPPSAAQIERTLEDGRTLLAKIEAVQARRA
jgi:hypothetical protein